MCIVSIFNPMPAAACIAIVPVVVTLPAPPCTSVPSLPLSIETSGSFSVPSAMVPPLDHRAVHVRENDWSRVS